MKNVITIELCAEDRARLDAILTALQAGPNCEGRVKSALDFVKTQEPDPGENIPAEQEAPAEVEPEPEPQSQPEPQPQPEPVKVDKSEIQKMVVALSGSGKKDEVRRIVLAYGNTKVSDIPADKLSEVWEKLTALAEG